MNKFQKLDLLKELKYKGENFVEPEDFQEFLIDCKLYLKPSSYGTRIQNRWRTDHNYKSVKSSEDSGDYKDSDEYVEFKVSYVSKGEWFLVQLRPYQNINRYDY